VVRIKRKVCLSFSLGRRLGGAVRRHDNIFPVRYEEELGTIVSRDMFVSILICGEFVL
jgi:hypothetical protein